MKKEEIIMWDRVVLKERGKEAIRRNYWKCVLVSLILMLFVQGSAGSSARGTSHSSDQNNTENYSYTVSAGTNAFNFNFDLGDGASILFRNPVIGFFHRNVFTDCCNSYHNTPDICFCTYGNRRLSFLYRKCI